MKQTTLFGEDPNPEVEFHVFHDESGTYVPGGGDQWLLHGIIIVPASKKFEVFNELQNVRSETNYWEEVHYTKLRKTRGEKANCYRGWLDKYVRFLSDFCFYHCLAIDTYSPSFDHKRFSEPFYAYNRFASMAVEGAIAWCLGSYKRLALKFFSDEKSRALGDNFEEYLPINVRNKRLVKGQEIRLISDRVIAVTSDPKKVSLQLKQECEIIQLTDLITGNINQVLTNKSKQKGKIKLAKMITSWINDINKPPWLQVKDLHRRFSLSCFPDENKQIFKLTLELPHEGQMKLFPG